MTSDSVHEAARPLADAINAATRSAHAKLNKLIIARLPLALPPWAADPSLYASGLLHIAPIYIAFESIWQDILDTRSGDSASEQLRRHDGLCDDRLLSVLENLHLPDLMRTDRLKADIRDMTGWSDQVLHDQLDAVNQAGRLAEFTSHIRRSIEHRPHVLLSYSYILYMALFAGGRFIRASLEFAGEPFWEQTSSPLKPTLQACEPVGHERKTSSESGHRAHQPSAMPLRFFHFSSSMDGEDLKRDFKKRFVDAEELLTTDEKHDIVQEAVCIFDNMSLLINQLDSVCGDSGRPPLSSRHSVHLLRMDRLRDSVVITQERNARLSDRHSSSNSSDDSSIYSLMNSTADAEAQTSPYLGASRVDIPQCPAMSSKSVHFDIGMPNPHHALSKTDPPAGSLDGSAEKAKRSSLAGIKGDKSWVTMVALGAFTLGALAVRKWCDYGSL